MVFKNCHKYVNIKQIYWGFLICKIYTQHFPGLQYTRYLNLLCIIITTIIFNNIIVVANNWYLLYLQLLEYNDTEDTADLNSYPLWNSTYRNNRPFTQFEWTKVQKLNESVVGFVFKSLVWQNESSLESSFSDEKMNTTPSLSFTVGIWRDF